jgi:hypothetical protein
MCPYQKNMLGMRVIVSRHRQGSNFSLQEMPRPRKYPTIS